MKLLIQLRNNPLLDHYLKYHSYWYKWLLRNPSLIREMENEMKKEYKLTMADKIGSFGERLETIRTFLEIIQ